MKLFVILVSLLSVAPAQTPAPAKPKPAAAAKTWRTPWGDPDLQGSWSNATTTPLERPAKYGGREFLTEQERAEQDKDTAIGTDRRSEPGSDADVNGAYNQFWWERGWSDGRTSLVVDPPDGRIPPRTPAGQKRLEAAQRAAAIESFDGPETQELYTRCIIRAALPRIPTGYDNNYEIVQSPGMVAIVQEQMHETRVIPLDGHAHLTSNVRQWLGDSRGHWEGDTLVVETTNFSDRATFMNATKNMKLIERWRRVADDRIDYRFTVEDPETWTRPWTAVIAWVKTGLLYEYACHEDNYGLYGILAGARAAEKKSAAR